MRFKKRVASLLGIGGLLGASFVGLSAPAAGAASVCDVSYIVSNKASGYGRFDGATTMRVRPYSACGSVGTFVSGTKFFYWCTVENSYGNTWIYGRIDGTQTKGWVYNYDVSWDAGTTADC
ncbi:hypothetical protein [Streptomyces prunicolor]